MIDVVEDRIPGTREWFVSRAAELLHDTARYAQQVASTEVRVRSSDLAGSIDVWPSSDGLEQVMGTPLWYGIYNEFGTGIYATGPGGSSAEQVPWVYYDEYLDQFFTTYGLTPQPFIRPGYEAGRRYLLDNAPRYFG